MQSFVRYFFLMASISAVLACQTKKQTGEELVSFRRMDNYSLPQQVIGFFYDYDYRNIKTINAADHKYQFADSFVRVSHLTETHYIIEINHKKLNIRERDFIPPFLLYQGRIYFTKTRIQFGKLQTPQDLMIYSAPLDSLLANK